MTRQDEAAPRAGTPELPEIQRGLSRIMSRFAPEYWRGLDASREFPTAFVDIMAEAGYPGVLIPPRFGGLDLGPAAASAIVEEINRAGGDASVINAQMAICGTLVRDGSEEQQERYLPALASGKMRLLTVAATEAESGADMTQLRSVGRRCGDAWTIDAQKVFISFARHTDLMILLVRTSDGPTLFLLDLQEVGSQLEMRPIELIAHRLTCTLFIDGLRLPDSCRLGPVGGGLRCLMKGFPLRRVLAAAESLGNARFFLDRSMEHAKTRRTFGRPIGQNQGVQYPLATAYAKTEAADLMRWDAVRLLEQGEEAGGRSALAKVLASEAAWEAARAALTTFGGWGLAAELDLERKLRDATVFVFNNMLLSYISEQVLGLPKAF